MAFISFVGKGQSAFSNKGNIVPSLPSGWQSDDIFICIISSSDNVNSTMPSGWIAIDPGTNNGSSLLTTTYYKIAVAGDTNPTVTHHGGSYIGATIIAYRGVVVTNPIDVIGTTTANNYSNIVTANSITTITNYAMVVFIGSISSRSTFSNYSGLPFTERLDTSYTTETETGGESPESLEGSSYLEILQTGYPSTFVADYTLTSAGSTGNATATSTSSGVSNGSLIALKPSTATIVCITDPSNANIYVDGVLQSVNTSTSITVSPGNHTITFSKAGYQSYTTTVTLSNWQTINVCAILQQIVTITDYGIVVCTSSIISSCPLTPITCPTSISPIDYVNFLAILTSISSISLIVVFTYMLNNIAYTANVPVNLSTGTNIVYAFSTNMRYLAGTSIYLQNVTLS